MLPRWHIFWGALFAVALFIIDPRTPLIYLALLFLSAIFIDLDHYIMAVFKSKKWSLKNAFEYHKIQAKIQEKEYKNKLLRKGDFHLFHTIEFHLLIGIIGLFFAPFFYIFIGMIFHSLLDIISLVYADRVYRREFSLIAYLLSNRKRNFKG